MKKYISKIVCVMLLATGISLTSTAQFVVKVRPEIRVVNPRPVAPGPKHVWVSGEYVWKDRDYVYHDGYWALPPEHRTRWVDGHWRHKRNGWVWIPGHWR